MSLTWNLFTFPLQLTPLPCNPLYHSQHFSHPPSSLGRPYLLITCGLLEVSNESLNKSINPWRWQKREYMIYAESHIRICVCVLVCSWGMAHTLLSPCHPCQAHDQWCMSVYIYMYVCGLTIRLVLHCVPQASPRERERQKETSNYLRQPSDTWGFDFLC